MEARSAESDSIGRFLAGASWFLDENPVALVTGRNHPMNDFVKRSLLKACL